MSRPAMPSKIIMHASVNRVIGGAKRKNRGAEVVTGILPGTIPRQLTAPTVIPYNPPRRPAIAIQENNPTEIRRPAIAIQENRPVIQVTQLNTKRVPGITNVQDVRERNQREQIRIYEERIREEERIRRERRLQEEERRKREIADYIRRVREEEERRRREEEERQREITKVITIVENNDIKGTPIILDILNTRIIHLYSIERANLYLEARLRIPDELLDELINDLNTYYGRILAAGGRASLRFNVESQDGTTRWVQYILSNKVFRSLIENLERGVIEEEVEVEGSDAETILSHATILNITLLATGGEGNKIFGYFKWMNVSNIDLTKYQIYNREYLTTFTSDEKIDDDGIGKPKIKEIDTATKLIEQCLVHTLRVSEKCSAEQILAVAQMFAGTGLWQKRSKSVFDEVSNKIGKRLLVKTLEGRNKIRPMGVYGSDKFEEVIEIGIVDEHCVLQEDTGIYRSDLVPGIKRRKGAKSLETLSLIKFMRKHHLLEECDMIKYGGFDLDKNYLPNETGYELLSDCTSDNRPAEYNKYAGFVRDWEQSYDIEKRTEENGGVMLEEDAATIARWEDIEAEEAEVEDDEEAARDTAIELNGHRENIIIYSVADIESEISDNYEMDDGNIKRIYHKPIAIGYKNILIIERGARFQSKLCEDLTRKLGNRYKREGVDYDCIKSFLLALLKENTVIRNIIDKYGKTVENGPDKIDCEGTKYKRIIYFHNVKYDFSVMLKELIKFNAHIISVVKRGSQIYSISIKVNNLEIELRDSYKLLPKSLADISRDFKLSKSKAKGVSFKFPYVKTGLMCDISEYEDYLDEEDKLEFRKNISDPEIRKQITIRGNRFSPGSYLLFYLTYDVLVLEEALLKLRAEMLDKLNTDPFQKLTVSGIAYKLLKDERGLEGVYSLRTGSLRFCKKAAPGGRSICNNKYKGQIIERPLMTIDGVALYPSAMNELCEEYGLPRGRAKRIPEPTLDEEYNIPLDTMLEPLINPDEKEYCRLSYYIVRIIITFMEVREIPIIQIKDKNGTTQYVNSINPGDSVEVVVDKYTLEDYIWYHKIKYRFAEGLYWNKGYNKVIGNLMVRWCNERSRVRYDNPALGEIYKLLMNSTYGRLMMNVPEYDERVLRKGGYNKVKLDLVNPETGEEIIRYDWEPDKKLNKYIARNGERIHSLEILDNGYFISKVYANTFANFNNVHCAAGILSMSKRAMNRLFDICEEINAPIYTTDTDSICTHKEKIPEIADVYRIKYGKELEGKALGQFHPDLELKDKRVAESTRSIFIGRKMYCMQLQSLEKDESQRGHEYKIRSKGIQGKAIEYKANNEYGGDPIALYKDAFDRTSRPKYGMVDCTIKGIPSKQIKDIRTKEQKAEEASNEVHVECIVPGTCSMKFDHMKGVYHKVSYKKVLRST